MKKYTLTTLIAMLLVTLSACSNAETSSATAPTMETNSEIVESTTVEATSTSDDIIASDTNNTAAIPESTLEDASTLEGTLEDASTLESSDTDSSNADNTSPLINGAAVYDDVFRGTMSYTSGPPMTYDRVMNMIASGEKHGEYLDSFYLVETIKALTIDECSELAGWNENYADRTIYEVNIIEDLISGEAVDRNEYIFVSMGNVEWQDKGDPIYAPGEKFTVVLAKPQQGCDFLRTPGSFMFRYDAVEDNAGNITLYSRNSAMDELNLPNSVSAEKMVITSTTLNPAFYSQAVELESLVSYIKTDWAQKEISSHFEKVSVE